MPWNAHTRTAGASQTACHWHNGPMKFASTSNIYGFGILILIYCVICILPKNCQFYVLTPTNPLLNTALVRAHITLGRNDRTVGAERPSTWGRTTALGTDVGRIDSGADRPVPFQTRAAATGKARSPTVDSRVRLTINDDDELERSRWANVTNSPWYK